MDVIRRRCDEVGRDPATLPVSVHLWWEPFEAAPSRRDVLARYAETGASRVMVLARSAARDPGLVDELFEEAAAAGVELASGQDGGAGAPVAA